MAISSTLKFHLVLGQSPFCSLYIKSAITYSFISIYSERYFYFIHSYDVYIYIYIYKRNPLRKERRSNTNSGNKLSTCALPTSAITKRPHKNFDNGNGHEPFIISTWKEESSLMDNRHETTFWSISVLMPLLTLYIEREEEKNVFSLVR